jgi:serine/threonine protein kinase
MESRSTVTSVTHVYEESGGRAAPVLADRYRLIAQLGRGGTARVVRAWDERLDREVAIKIFQPHADPVGRLRFEDEARILASFDHPGLVKVYDSGVSHGDPFLVLELIDGPQLGRRIDEGPLGVDATRTLGAALAESLAYVHSRGVVHRDVKPGNVLLDARGKPYLADFGLAKLLDRSGITASDRLVGTAAYLSPEQVLGTTVGPAADIYSLGLVLLECLTGEVEYPGMDAETVLARISRRPRIPVGVPAAFASALEAMTRNEPETRPSAAECVDMLQAQLPTAPIVRKRQVSRSAVLLCVGAGVVASAIGLWVATPTSDAVLPPGSHQQGPAVGSTLGPVTPVSPAGVTSSSGTRHSAPAQDQGQDQKSTPTVTTTPSTPDGSVAKSGGPPEDPGSERTKKSTKTKTKTKTVSAEDTSSSTPDPG